MGKLFSVPVNCSLSNRTSYYVYTFNDASYVVCRVEVATPPVQVLFPHPGTLKTIVHVARKELG